MPVTLRRFIIKSAFRLWKINILLIILILFDTLLANSKVTPQTRIIDRDGIKEVLVVLSYFIQPIFLALLFWTNYLTGKTEDGGNIRRVFNKPVILTPALCHVTAAVLFMNGSFNLLTDGGAFNIIFGVIYWLFNIIFIVFTTRDAVIFNRHNKQRQ